jgi:pimeloyl-ACP methyl ester carboxylesterase
MPYLNRPDGATIYYEVHGDGFPILLFAPGGINSQIEWWHESASVHAIEILSDEWMVIAMDQRNAGRSFGPLAPVTYDVLFEDHIALLDSLGLERCHVMGGCIGVSFALRLIMGVPGRIAAAVCQKPVGRDESNSMETFTAMFQPTIALARESGMEAVVASAVEKPIFNRNNAAGPWALRLKNDADFRKEFSALPVGEYERIVTAYSDGLWPDGNTYFSVPDAWLPECRSPLLILPGADRFHPTEAARRLALTVAHGVCLEPDWHYPENIFSTYEAAKQFLRQHTPA